MNTTALLVDILIIGIQVLIWMTGFVFSFLFSPNIVQIFSEKFPALFLFLVVALSYTLGVIFDYIISVFFRPCKSKKEKETYRDGLVISILSHDKEIQKFLDNQYARLRIARATVCNLPLITIATCCFILTNEIEIRWYLYPTIFIILLFGAIMTVAAIYGWKMRNKVYWGYIKETLKIIEKKK